MAGTEKLYVIVDSDEKPLADVEPMTLEQAEAYCRAEWAVGLIRYHLPEADVQEMYGKEMR